VSGTRHEAKELRHGEDEVEDLWYEEEQHGLAEVAEDCDHGKRHPGEVTERVADEHSRWIPNNSNIIRVYVVLVLRHERTCFPYAMNK